MISPNLIKDSKDEIMIVKEIQLENGDKCVAPLAGEIISGFGIIYLPDGSPFKGFFKCGKKNGYGIIYYKDGSITKGKYKDDKKCGLFITTNVDGTQSFEYFKN